MASDEDDGLRSKIRDPALHEQIFGSGTMRLTVIVELEAPAPRLTTKPATGSGRRRFAFEPDDDAEAVAAKAADALGDLIEKVTGERPPYLSAARAYVVDATGDQIRRLVASPLVRSVQPNRRLAR